MKNIHLGLIPLVKLKTYCFFSRFSNCTNSTKLHKASYIKIYKINHAIFLCLKKMPSGFFETTYNFWKSCNAKLHKIFLCQTVWKLFQSWCIVFMIYPLIKTDAKTTRHQKVYLATKYKKKQKKRVACQGLKDHVLCLIQHTEFSGHDWILVW